MPALLVVASCAHGGVSPSSVAVVEIPPAPRDAASASEDPPSDPTALVGRWSGVARQPGSGSFPIDVTLESVAPGICAHVHYPSLPCSAEWTCTDSSRRGVLHAREALTDGQDACVDAGEITISLLRDGRASWFWAADGATARAVLTREAPGP